MSRSLLLPCLSLLLCVACGAPGASLSAWPGEVERWGSLREALHDGQTQARVQLDDVARPGLYAVGALTDLAGEVTVVDGEVWVTQGHAEQPLTSRDTAASATVLFAAQVDTWTDVPVTADVDPSAFDAWLAEQATAAGIDPGQPFPFVVEGALRPLRLHVIAGQCPKRAKLLGEDVARPPYELHADATAGRLVGLHAPGSSGVMCQAGQRSHVHAVLAEGDGLTGHVDAVGLAAGAVLRLPAP